MSIFDGGGGDLKSVTLPHAFLEISFLLATTQAAANLAYGGALIYRLISIFGDPSINRVSISAAIPAVPVIFGALTTPVNHFGLGFDIFNPGSGEIQELTKVAAFVAIAQKLAIAQIEKLPPPLHYCKFSDDGQFFNVVASIPARFFVQANSKILFEAIDYLWQ